MPTSGVPTVRKYNHDISNYRLMSGDMGFIYPIGLWEVLPSDAMTGHTSLLIRMSPMTAPVMHPITAETFTVFTPNRLLWNKEIDGTTDWETFITGGADGMDASSPPTITTTGTKGDLLDHLGLPLVAGKSVNAMPLRAINLTFNEWFRDQDLVAERALDDTTLPVAAWKRDYFNTARPFTQKGPNIQLPLGDRAPVACDEGGGAFVGVDFTQAEGEYRRLQTSGTDATLSATQATPGAELYANLAEATGANVNDVRRAYALQRFAEARAAYGSRYVEYLKKAFGASPADARLQRPELIATGRAKVNISEVLQTGPESDRTDPTYYGVGDMYGHGIAGLRSHKFRKRFQEHGYLITYLVVRPRTLYSQGIDKHFLNTDKEDWFQHELQHIGQQNVLLDEIYADPGNTETDVFGYQDRYRQYRETPSKVCGDFRDTLDFWHMARKFDQAPALNEDFINAKVTKRIFNVQSEDTLWVAAQHKMFARRLVAKNAVGKIL